MRRVGTVVLVVLGLVLASGSTASAQVRGLGRLSGQVVDATGAGMAGAELVTQSMSGDPIKAQTDASGNWTLAGLGKGEWTVIVKKPGFVPKTLKVTIEKELDSFKPVKVTLNKAA